MRLGDRQPAAIVRVSPCGWVHAWGRGRAHPAALHPYFGDRGGLPAAETEAASDVTGARWWMRGVGAQNVAPFGASSPSQPSWDVPPAGRCCFHVKGDHEAFTSGEPRFPVAPSTPRGDVKGEDVKGNEGCGRGRQSRAAAMLSLAQLCREQPPLSHCLQPRARRKKASRSLN